MLRTLRQEYWILDGRNLVKTYPSVYDLRQSTKIPIQLMEDLSKLRVNSSPPFFHTG
jgi:hypothetical protein